MYFYKIAKHCLIAHRIYEASANPNKPKYITEVQGEAMAKFIVDAMNEKKRLTIAR